MNNKTSVVVYLAVGTILAVSGAAQADIVTFRFDPDDLIQLYPGSAGDQDVAGENKATQVNARRTHQPWATNWYETFYNPAGPKTQPDSYNTYVNWRDGLGEDEGISAFNIWLLDNPNARSWGEKMVWDPAGPAPTGTADTAGKWDVAVDVNPWGPGWLVQWSTADPANYINTVSNIGDFSFSGTAYWDNNANGYDATDPEVEIGEVARIWFGAVNWTESDGQDGWTQDWSLHFDGEGWGSRVPNDGGPWSAGLIDAEDYGSGYEGVLDITAVPIPGAVILGVLGLGAAGLKLRKYV